ncbi:neuronal acetylcholine receptor subunit beta-3-like [Physella acuta]|uniref:neuronal acetylcholine receptor subunit beta-3-like n=1 Tax=Physella acuta TaxID=109671 RepID=UPI0027DCEDFC|nr:neuronal acetylcholine receptor subunit beta-3-like [Physella acuta]
MARSQTYNNVTAIFNDKIINSGYNPDVRPLVDQSKVIIVEVGFELVSIVEINEVAQSFTCNGFVMFAWKDEMTALTLNLEEMQFRNSVPTIGTSFYTLHGEWDLTSATIITSNLSSGVVQVPTFQFKFTLKRRPIFLIVNIILPVVFLSFLNILVFIIPVESGEKIGYGITVLLALSVFMSIVGGMLPRSSRSMPIVTIYLFILLIISMLTVIDSIVIVYLSHREEKERQHLKAKRKFKDALTKAKNSVAPLDNEPPTGNDKVQMTTLGKAVLSFSSQVQNEEKPEVNRYKVTGKYMDKVSFVVFLVIWISVTLGFLIFASTSLGH